jgi:hypothetical protein
MKTIRNEKGFALGFVMVLAAIALVFTLAMLVMVSRSSFISGQQKRYRTAVEAGHGGVGAMLQLISSRGVISDNVYSNQSIPSTTNLGTKLSRTSTSWGSIDNSITIDPDVSSSYDMRIDLGTYRVYTKIVDTVEGNSGADEGPVPILNMIIRKYLCVAVIPVFCAALSCDRKPSPSTPSTENVTLQGEGRSTATGPADGRAWPRNPRS